MLTPSSYFTFYSSPLGEILLTGNEAGLSGLSFIDKSHINTSSNILQQSAHQENNIYFKKVIAQLDEYFSGERKTFTLKLSIAGTDFQKKVWQALTAIPYGTTASYQEVAQKINKVKAVRAVGRANGANPIALIIPCHRVIGASGSLTGYAYGVALKAKLLRLEKAIP